MDIVTDLTAEAVSYITTIQDICKSGLTDDNRAQLRGGLIWDVFTAIGAPSPGSLKHHEVRIGEIIWSSSGPDNSELKTQYFLSSANRLLKWLKPLFLENAAAISFDEKRTIEKPGIWATPDYWRHNLKQILYEKPEARIGLVYAINYMPVLVIYALASKKPDVYHQRLYQFYFETNDNPEDYPVKPESLLTSQDLNASVAFWDSFEKYPAASLPLDFRSLCKRFLEDDAALLKHLNFKEITIPFETFFDEELDEIEMSRKARLAELNNDDIAKFPLPVPGESTKGNPQHRADEMQLAALAFSGGGIRSATFGLGILQKLAELDVLPRFDYLSTVSGGGYIGTWLTSWIYRDGSLKKVNDRLNKQKSSNPLAEEVRPIRWLRMFSNYLAPNASIMSTDSWTIGITWLRNTLINQVILLLLLLTVLSAINVVYNGWIYLGNADVQLTKVKVLMWSTILISVGSFLSGSGMRVYDRAHPPQSKFNLGKSWVLAHLLIGWGVIASFLITLWFFTTTVDLDFLTKILLLWPAAVPCFFGMLFIAFIGGYQHNTARPLVPKSYDTFLVLAIVFSTLGAAIAGVVFMAGAFQLIQYLSDVDADTVWCIPQLAEKLVLVCGVPLILEAISLTVVARMALMGSFFPDERREWWGRMGALVHRFILFWILVTVAALLLPPYFKVARQQHLFGHAITLLGGWIVIIGGAVKVAFQSKTAGDKPTGGIQVAQEIFIRVAPYLFMIGFLLIGAYTLDMLNVHILNLLINSLKDWQYVICTLILAAITALLSWRVGVNEFSLHDFYRNRLVRAYMGATRRRTDRENTANSFTGFDKDDDYPLALMRAGLKYTGPFPLINTTLNATTVYDLDRQDRMAESFLFTPMYCGFDFNPTRSASYTRNQVYDYGYRPTVSYSGAPGPLIGTAMAISGAAANPNMGYHSSPATAFLLTIFNVRLGRWLGNPRKDTWKRSDPKSGLGYLVKDLVGKSDIDSDYICLSDGGHFDNMGLYELIRRRCSYIVLADAEEDTGSTCEGLANAIRRCRIDFGVEIIIDVKPITEKIPPTKFTGAHLVWGVIKYPDAVTLGKLIYIKTSLTDDEDVDIREYFLNNPDFPQQSTGDQFFDEEQFESYRKLGYHSIKDATDL